MTRIDIAARHERTARRMNALSEAAAADAASSGLDQRLVELVRIRVSQINGCAYCLRMHTADALAAGEDPDRLAVLPAWRETTDLFDPAARAALALAEAITEVADSRVDDAVYDAAAAVLIEDQVSAIAWLAIVMNAWNRLAITSRYLVTPE
ncbi:carboxymuconolactone decarboxylase family protein [Brachybacterium huguangmaarense]